MKGKNLAFVYIWHSPLMSAKNHKNLESFTDFWTEILSEYIIFGFPAQLPSQIFNLFHITVKTRHFQPLFFTFHLRWWFQPRVCLHSAYCVHGVRVAWWWRLIVDSQYKFAYKSGIGVIRSPNTPSKWPSQATSAIRQGRPIFLFFTLTCNNQSNVPHQLPIYHTTMGKPN